MRLEPSSLPVLVCEAVILVCFLPQMNGWVREEVDDEVAGGRASLATKCGIPVSDIQGFRQPFLQASPTVREVRGASSWIGEV